MENKAIRGVRWTLLSYASGKVITVLTTLVLVRLLAPRDFGLMTMALIVTGILQIYAELGLGGAMILRQEVTGKALGTVLTTMVGLACLIALVGIGLAPLVAWAFDQPDSEPIIMVLCASMALSGFASFYDTLLRRELEFGRQLAASMISAVAYASIAISAAVAGAGVWSLVWGQIGAGLAALVALVALAPYRVRPTWDTEVARTTLQSGRGFVLQATSGFIAQNAGNLAVGRVLGATQLGFFSRGFYLAELPYRAIAEPVARVTFPTFARMRHRGEDVGPTFLTTLRMVALITAPIGVTMSACAEPLVATLLGDKWLPAVGALTWLGVWSAFHPAVLTNGWLLNSVGEARIVGRIAAVALFVTVPGYFLAASLGGIVAVAVWLAATTLSVAIVQAWIVARRAGVSLARQWEAVRAVTIASAAVWVAASVTSELCEGLAPGVRLSVSLVAAALAYALVLSAVDRRVLREGITNVRRIVLGRRVAATVS